MNFNLEKKFIEFLKLITRNAQNQKIRVFFVGGAVRDNLINQETKDFDLIIDSNAVEFSKTLPKEIEIKSVHEQFGTVKLKYNNFDIDLASTRVENYPSSGCLPQIKKLGVDINEDIKRRDFTLNSLYSEITLKNKELAFSLIDLVNGVEDLKNKTLKVLHKNSYIDDPTRIFRGLAYKYRFGFDFSTEDKVLINDYLNNVKYQDRSEDRILAVLKDNLSCKFGYLFFKDLINRKYFKILSDNKIDVDFKLIEDILSKFNLECLDRGEFLLKILLNEENINIQKDKIFNCFRKIKNFDLAFYYYKTKDNDILKFLKIKDIKISLKGSDLLDLGYKQGRIFNKIFEKLLEEKISNQNLFLTKNDEIDFVKKTFPLT